MPRSRRSLSVSARGLVTSLTVLALAVVLLGGCDGDEPPSPDAPREAALPDGLTLHLDQSRVQRQGRAVFVRLVEETPRRVTVIRAEVSSERFDPVTWTGERTFDHEADLDLELPRGRCGRGSDATVRLTYRVDDGPWQVSTAPAKDRYGAVGLFLDRDCAELAMGEAAELSLGTPRVRGAGRRSVFELPVRLTPTGKRTDVGFAGFEDTVLFRVVDPSPRAGRTAVVAMRPGASAVRPVLRLVPSRCDPHALAEDKVGTLIGVRVAAPELAANASFYLPLPEETRSSLRGFFAVHCGL